MHITGRALHLRLFLEQLAELERGPEALRLLQQRGIDAAQLDVPRTLLAKMADLQPPPEVDLAAMRTKAKAAEDAMTYVFENKVRAGSKAEAAIGVM